MGGKGKAPVNFKQALGLLTGERAVFTIRAMPPFLVFLLKTFGLCHAHKLYETQAGVRGERPSTEQLKNQKTKQNLYAFLSMCSEENPGIRLTNIRVVTYVYVTM